MTRRGRIEMWWPCVLGVWLLTLSCADSGAETSAEPSSAEPAAAQSSGGAQRSETEADVTLVDPLQEYDARCASSEDLSLDCEWLRSLIVAQVVHDLEAIERARDQRGVAFAMSALEVVDEPAVLIAAASIMGQFVETPGLAEKAIPLVDSPYHEVQRVAAALLGRVPDPALNAIAHQWSTNLGAAPVLGVYDRLELPEHYAGMGFPEYPGAKRYSPVDSDRSIGWWSSDPASTVASELGEPLGVEVMTAQQWTDRTDQRMMAAFQSFDQSKLEQQAAKIGELTAEYMKSQDPKVMAQIEALQNELQATSQQMEEQMGQSDQGVDYVARPSQSAAPDQIYYLIAEEKDGHVARLVMVYRQPVLDRTVMQMAWDLRDYPPAWSQPEE